MRVGSRLVDIDPLSAEVQTRLPRGAEVRIVGRRDDWLEIVPPDGAHYFIHEDYVERISAEVAARLRAAATSQPTTAPAADASEVRGDQSPDLTGPWGQRLVLAETAIAAESHKPPLQQSWTGPIARLRPIAEQAEEPLVARLAAQWIVRLEARMVDQAALRAARDLTDEAARSRTRLDRELDQVRRAREQAEHSRFTARGQLRPSIASGSAPSRPPYMLADPLTGRVVVYLTFPAGANMRPADFVDKYVGVSGVRRSEKLLGADVIAVDRIETLRPESATAQPARKNP